MKLRNWDDVLREKWGEKYEERKAQIKDWVTQELLELTLAELRKECGLTQDEIAARLGMHQNGISMFEGREDHLLSTLRKYVEALDGKLEVVAVFGDKTIRLRGV